MWIQKRNSGALHVSAVAVTETIVPCGCGVDGEYWMSALVHRKVDSVEDAFGAEVGFVSAVVGKGDAAVVGVWEVVQAWLAVDPLRKRECDVS